MRRLIFVYLSATVLIACSGGKQNVNLQEQLKKDTMVNSHHIIFAQPLPIDSSNIVIYPLVFSKEDFGSSYGSSSNQRASYWNLIFYDTETRNQNLLTADRKILIYTINIGSSASSSYSTDNVWMNGIGIYDENIIYTAVATDYDRNNKLDDNDPSYLFVSKRDGNGFRQISPDNYNITSWEVLKGTSKIIMQAQRDANGDKIFNEKDVAVPFIVDVNSQKPAVETFSPKFIDSIEQRLVTIWKQ